MKKWVSIYFTIAALSLHRAQAASGDGSGATSSDEPLITLEQVIELALRHNPEMQSVEAGVRATAKSITAREPFLPPPIFTVGSMGSQGVFSSSGHMETSYSMSQTIPFPMKSLLKRRALKNTHRASEASQAAFILNLKRETKKSYFNYLEASQRLALLQELQGVYQQHWKRLRSSPAQDQLTKAHILSAQAEIDLLGNEIIGAKNNKSVRRGELNVLMGRDAYAPLGDPHTPPRSPLPEEPNPQKRLNHPELQMIAAKLEAALNKRAAARSAWLPDLMLSYRMNRRDDELPNNSELMVGASLPFVTFWAPRAEAAEANARLEVLKGEQIQKQNDLSLRSMKAYAVLLSLHEQLQNLEEKLLPLSKRRVDLVASLSLRDRNTLNEHRAALEQSIELRLQAVEKGTQYEAAISEFESLILPSDSMQRKEEE